MDLDEGVPASILRLGISAGAEAAIRGAEALAFTPETVPVGVMATALKVAYKRRGSFMPYHPCEPGDAPQVRPLKKAMFVLTNSKLERMFSNEIKHSSNSYFSKTIF